MIQKDGSIKTTSKNYESIGAIGLPMLPIPVSRVQLSYQHDSKVQITKAIPRKKDFIIYKSPKEILSLVYLADPILPSNQEVLKLVKELVEDRIIHNRLEILLKNGKKKLLP